MVSKGTPTRSRTTPTTDLPDGKLRSLVTYLEMLAPPPSRVVPVPPPRTEISQSVRPPVHFYRYLYNTIGAPWLWGDRRRLQDRELAEIIGHPNVRIDVLYVGGVPAGYVELDARSAPDIELAYFGLMPEFIGQKLGVFFLEYAIRAAWSCRPGRIWVHTCSLDHPRALSMYERAGFVRYRQVEEIVDDPRALGLISA
jgi:GNAT superfamily N-acetyltransferase